MIPPTEPMSAAACTHACSGQHGANPQLTAVAPALAHFAAVLTPIAVVILDVRDVWPAADVAVVDLDVEMVGPRRGGRETAIVTRLDKPAAPKHHQHRAYRYVDDASSRQHLIRGR